MVKSQFLYLWCIKRDIELAFFVDREMFKKRFARITTGNADDSMPGVVKEKTARTVRQIKSSCPDRKHKKSREAGGRGAHGQQENPKSESIC